MRWGRGLHRYYSPAIKSTLARGRDAFRIVCVNIKIAEFTCPGGAADTCFDNVQIVAQFKDKLIRVVL